MLPPLDDDDEDDDEVGNIRAILVNDLQDSVLFNRN